MNPEKQTAPAPYATAWGDGVTNSDGTVCFPLMKIDVYFLRFTVIAAIARSPAQAARRPAGPATVPAPHIL